MPRKDNTYSDKDVIRIFCFHLTVKEQLITLLFFQLFLIAKGVFPGKALLDIIPLPRSISNIFDVIDFVADFVLDLIGFDDIIDGFIPEDRRETFATCLKRLRQRF